MPGHKPNDPAPFPVRGTPGGFRDWWEDADPDVLAAAQAERETEQRLARVLAANRAKTLLAQQAGVVHRRNGRHSRERTEVPVSAGQGT